MKELSKEDQTKYDKIMKNRVRLRCTGKNCDMRHGFWTAPKFVDMYVNERKCMLCGSKNAHMIQEVKEDA